MLCNLAWGCFFSGMKGTVVAVGVDCLFALAWIGLLIFSAKRKSNVPNVRGLQKA